MAQFGDRRSDRNARCRVACCAVSEHAKSTYEKNRSRARCRPAAGLRSCSAIKSALKPSSKSKTLHPASRNPCAQYGVGVAKIAGSDTCVKIGGSVSVEGSGSARR